MRIWAVSLYKSYNSLGTLLDYEDRAGAWNRRVAGPPPAPPRPAAAVNGPCKRKLKAVNTVQRRIRSLRKRAERGSTGARRKLRRTRRTRTRAVRAMKTPLPPPAEEQAPPAPAAAPPGCELVTKPVLQQEGTGIYASRWSNPKSWSRCSKSS